MRLWLYIYIAFVMHLLMSGRPWSFCWAIFWINVFHLLVHTHCFLFRNKHRVWCIKLAFLLWDKLHFLFTKMKITRIYSPTLKKYKASKKERTKKNRTGHYFSFVVFTKKNVIALSAARCCLMVCAFIKTIICFSWLGNCAWIRWVSQRKRERQREGKRSKERQSNWKQGLVSCFGINFSLSIFDAPHPFTNFKLNDCKEEPIVCICSRHKT